MTDDDVVQSPEKVRALIDEVPVMLARSRDQKLQGLVGFWPMLQPTIEQMLPADAAQLDVVLEQLAIYALRARSDDARGFLMRVERGEIAVQLLDHAAAAAAAPANGGAPAADELVDDDDVDDLVDDDGELIADDDVPTEPMGPPLAGGDSADDAAA